MAERLIHNGELVVAVDQIGPDQVDGRWNGYVSPGANPDNPRSWGGGLRYDILQRRIPIRGANYSIGYVEGAGEDARTWIDVHTVLINDEPKELIAVGLYSNETGTEA